MNQDFALSASPALARRLLLLQSVSKLDLPSDLHTMAAQNCLSEADFDPFVCAHSAERMTITQFLLDVAMRGIVQAQFHPTIDEATIVNALRLSHAPKLTIISRRANKWRPHINSQFLTDVDIRPLYSVTGAWIDTRRDGVLVVDLCDEMMVGFQHQCNRFVREFPRLILYQPLSVELKHLTHWTILAAMLFPTMPHPWMVRLFKNNPPHWMTLKLINFAHFYNMCLFPQYIKSAKLLAALEDSVVDMEIARALPSQY
jgi:hypothetical protein